MHIVWAVVLAWAGIADLGPDFPSGRSPGETNQVVTGGSIAGQVAAFREQFRVLEEALSRDLVAARAAGERGSEARSRAIVAASARFQQGCDAIAARVGTLVREHPADPAALDGILLLGGSFDDDLAGVIRDHFLGDDRLGRLCAVLPSRTTDSTRVLLEEIAARGTDRRVRGQAMFALGLYSQGLYKALVEGRRLTADQQQMLPAVDRRFYKESIADRRLTPPEQDALLREARRAFEHVVAEYPDVRSDDGAALLADRARAGLDWFANLPQLKVGRPAPPIIGEDLDGRPLDLAAGRGKVVVLCFWATWCKPCMEIVPAERELVRRLQGKPFALVGINCDEAGDRAKVKKVAVENRMEWSSYWDGGLDGPIQTRYNVDHYPTIYVLDAQGTIRFIDPRGDDLDRAVNSLIREQETSIQRSGRVQLLPQNDVAGEPTP